MQQAPDFRIHRGPLNDCRVHPEVRKRPRRSTVKIRGPHKVIFMAVSRKPHTNLHAGLALTGRGAVQVLAQGSGRLLGRLGRFWAAVEAPAQRPEQAGLAKRVLAVDDDDWSGRLSLKVQLVDLAVRTEVLEAYALE